MADAAPPFESGAQAKTFRAERAVGFVRLAVVSFNIAAYYLFLPRAVGVPWLADAISVIAFAYSVYVVGWQPYRRFSILRTSLWTAGTDFVLIVLWLTATGGSASPFYLLWYLSLLAVIFRYDTTGTIVATALYMAGYVAMYAAEGVLVENAITVTIRVVYILLVGTLGSFMVKESVRAFEERFEAERRMQEAQEQEHDRELARLRELDRFKSEFINAAAHELNTPLTPLRLQMHLLKRGSVSDRDKALAIVDRNLERLSMLVQDMLDVARMQSGRLPLAKERLDLVPLLHESVQTFRDLAESRSVAVAVEAPPHLWTTADRARVVQVVYNLLSNAVKYTPSGGRITLAATSGAGGPEVIVQDTGVGLTKEQLARLFQPFTQVHEGHVQAFGTGLGLYISRGIVERHGGRLSAESPGPGRGSTFRFNLPAGG